MFLYLFIEVSKMKGKLPPIVAGNRNIITVSQKIH